MVSMSKLWCNEGFTGGATSRSGRQLQIWQDEENNPVRSIFATPDLLQDILCPLIDEELLPLSSLSTVLKSFRKAILLNQIWQEMCYQQWKGKWGFHLRWEKALVDYSNIASQQQRQNEHESTEFWKSRYFAEERDATRQFILADELKSLVFDFRFWTGQPEIAVDHRCIVVKSGLLESASREFWFSRPLHRSEEDDASVSPYSARGRIVGHPSKETGIKCKCAYEFKKEMRYFDIKNLT